MYCNTLYCIAEKRAQLYCRRLGCREIVSQYKNCIVTRQGTWAGLYCNTATALATRRWAGAGGAAGRAGRARGAQVAGRARQARAGRVAWARGLATGCALDALCLFSIRIDSVLFLSRFLDIVREPGS